MLKRNENDMAGGTGRGMLPKLLRYEFRATARLYLPLYLVVLVFGLLGRFSIHGVPWEVVSGSNKVGLWASVRPAAEGFWGEVLAALTTLIIVAYVLGALGAFVVHFIITIQRFWKNLMGDEGYLMFTLPVSSRQLLWSKAIPAFVWGIGTVVTVAASVLLLCWTPAATQSLLRLFRESSTPEVLFLVEQWFPRVFWPSFWLLFPVAMVIDAFSGLFLLYAAMPIGHTVHRHKIWASIGAYFAISMVMGMATSVLTSALLPVIIGSRQLPEDFVTQAEMLQFADVVGELVNGTMLLGLVISAVSLVVFYLLARYLLDTQLNLE